jgi:hypothetical protein
MKSILSGSLAAVFTALIAFFVLSSTQTESYALSKGTGADIRQEAGNNLVGKDFSIKGH